MINVEIEILSERVQNDVYELRNLLESHIENIQIAVKEQPAMQGQMSPFSTEGILNGVIHAGIGIGIEQCMHILLPLIRTWIKGKKAESGKKIEVLATMGDGASKVMIAEDSEGISKRYDTVAYSIDISRTRAILIGASEFEYDFLPIAQVKSNIEDLSRLIADKRNIGLPAENITVALDKSNSELEELLLGTCRMPGMETLIIYFSGHGYRSDINKLYLIARNSRKIDGYILNGIDYDFIKNVVLKSSPAKQKIIILDACHSGIATQGDDDLIMDINVTGTYVLASSQSDEVSYFDKNRRHTFFTEALLETLGGGIENTKEMLSLNDIYEDTSKRLDQKQQPRFKSRLNISPSDFFVARNPSFSLEKNIRYAAQLRQAGKLAEALREYKKIVQRMPDNNQLKLLTEECSNDLLFAQFIREADELFFRDHNYEKAMQCYQQAYDVKPDFSVAEKISKCKDFLSAGVPVPAHASQDDEHHNQARNGKIIKTIIGLVIAIIVVAGGWMLLTFLQHKKEKNSMQALTRMLTTDTKKALAELKRSKQKDSANYIIGNYFREEKRYDSAAFYYKKAIDAAKLPAAFSALGELYFNNNLKDSNDLDIAQGIFKTADSLFKADTTAYYYLGIINARGALYNLIIDWENPDGLMTDAERFFLKGIKGGSKRCVNELAFLYLFHKGDPAMSFPYMKQAAENNFAKAQLYLSDMLEHGNGTSINKVEADKWFQLYIINAGPAELIEMGENLYYGKYPYPEKYALKKDCEKSFVLLHAAEKRAGIMGDSFREKGELYFYLGQIYQEGCADKLQKNLTKAIDFYKKAAELGNEAAKSQLKSLKVKF